MLIDMTQPLFPNSLLLALHWTDPELPGCQGVGDRCLTVIWRTVKFALNILRLSCCDGTVSLRRRRDGAQSTELAARASLAVPAAWAPLF